MSAKSLRTWQASCLACGNSVRIKQKLLPIGVCAIFQVGFNHASDPWIATRRLGVGHQNNRLAVRWHLNYTAALRHGRINLVCCGDRDGTLQSKTHAITLVCHFPCMVQKSCCAFFAKLIELGADHSADFRRPFTLLYAYAFVRDHAGFVIVYHT